MKIAIVTPTYNEVDNIAKLIGQLAEVCRQLSKITFVLVVVDDNSPDGTAQVAESFAKSLKTQNFSVRLFRRPVKEGVGKAYIAAISALIKEDFDYIIQIDADLSHNPKYIKDLVTEAGRGHDFVATSRYMEGGGILDWGLHRRLLSRAGNIYTRAILGDRITDYTNGLNMFKTDLLKRLEVGSLGSGGYGFFIELKYKALQHAKSFTQIPIILTDRTQGKSKIPKNTILVNLVLVPKLKFKVKQP